MIVEFIDEDEKWTMTGADFVQMRTKFTAPESTTQVSIGKARSDMYRWIDFTDKKQASDLYDLVCEKFLKEELTGEVVVIQIDKKNDVIKQFRGERGNRE